MRGGRRCPGTLRRLFHPAKRSSRLKPQSALRGCLDISRFIQTVLEYVCMCLAPSFLPSPAVRVTRITESKRRRMATSKQRNRFRTRLCVRARAHSHRAERAQEMAPRGARASRPITYPSDNLDEINIVACFIVTSSNVRQVRWGIIQNPGLPF